MPVSNLKKEKQLIEEEYKKIFGPNIKDWPMPLCSSAKRIYETVRARVQERLKSEEKKTLKYKLRVLAHKIAKFINRLSGYRIWVKGEEPEIYV